MSVSAMYTIPVTVSTATPQGSNKHPAVAGAPSSPAQNAPVPFPAKVSSKPSLRRRIRWFAASAISTLWPHGARPDGNLRRPERAGPSLKPAAPLPAMVPIVLVAALIRLMRDAPGSAIIKSPFCAYATARGNDRHASTPIPPSPLNRGAPQPAALVMARDPINDNCVLVGVDVALGVPDELTLLVAEPVGDALVLDAPVVVDEALGVWDGQCARLAARSVAPIGTS